METTVLRHLFFMAVFALTAISTAVSAEYPQNLPQDFKRAFQQFNCTRNWPEALSIDGYHNPSDDWLVVVHSRPDHEFLISYIFRNGEERILEIYLDREGHWIKIKLPSDDDIETSSEQSTIRQILNYGADCVTLNFPVPKLHDEQEQRLDQG
jgi:hypothetical protein